MVLILTLELKNKLNLSREKSILFYCTIFEQGKGRSFWWLHKKYNKTKTYGAL